MPEQDTTHMLNQHRWPYDLECGLPGVGGACTIDKQGIEEAKGRDVMFRAWMCAVLLDSTETWTMLSSTFTVLWNAFHAFIRPLKL